MATQVLGKIIKCPKCKSQRMTKDGSRRGTPQFKCKVCGHVTCRPYGMR